MHDTTTAPAAGNLSEFMPADAADGRPLYTCHRDWQRLPALPPDHYVDVTFGAFGEGDLGQVRGYIFDRMLGRSNEVAF